VTQTAPPVALERDSSAFFAGWLARAYADRFPEEISPFLEESARPLDALLSLYPFLEVAR
jgi:hypothetical protein